MNLIPARTFRAAAALRAISLGAISMLGTSLLTASLLGASLPARAGDVVKKPEFTITLPDGWTEAPQSAMVPFNARVARAMPPNAPKNMLAQYQYGFQPKAAAHWLSSYPFMVVTITSSHRIPESEFKQMESLDLNKELHKHQELLSSTIERIAVGKALYDPSSHTVWMAGEMAGPNKELIRGLSALVATRDGYVQFVAYVPAAQFAASYPALRRAMMSVVIPPGMRY